MALEFKDNHQKSRPNRSVAHLILIKKKSRWRIMVIRMKKIAIRTRQRLDQ